jgi:phosphoribosylamine--glycine ligase
MNILVLGSGGREHAIVTSLAASPQSDIIFVAPGNGGSASGARNVEFDMMDAQAVVAFAVQNDVGLVVIGPEAPLVAGVGDAVRAAGLLCFGPGADGARMEGSKQFSKEFMERHSIPTAAFASFTYADDALAYLKDQTTPVVVKADGLAAGKGVTVAESIEEAEQAVRECFAGRFGEAGATVVIEECMTGPECSLLVFTDGSHVLPMAPAQDHKRAHEGDTGPNTGGMGVYSPVPIVTDEEYARMLSYMEQTVAGLASEDIDYRGVLYGGFMLTPEGPKVLEFNARFGDPETQVILPRLKTDLLEVMLAVARGDVANVVLGWDDAWAVSVVLASAGYPGDYEKGKVITGIEDAEAISGVTVYHAGTARLADGTLVTNGGRVLNVTALGSSFKDARDRAYEACDLISFEGAWMRRDIGSRALRGRSAWSTSESLVLEDMATISDGQAFALTSEDKENAKKTLNKSKRDVKRARRAAANAAEEAALKARKEARRKRNEELKITVVDGNVVDNQGRIIRPYTRAEQFFDNKILVYILLGVFILVCLAAVVLLNR